MFDMHRHDCFSTFDGYGQPTELAKLAKELGYKTLCSTNHGNTNSLIQTYKACKEHDLKAILGVEGYFLPEYKPQTRGFHLLLVAKNLAGYKNLNILQTEGDKQKYYSPIWDFDLLEKHHDGLICTSGCVGGYLGQCIYKNKLGMAEKFLIKMKKIFADDFYIEIQPYVVSEPGMQETINVEAIKLGKKLGIKCILTSDSHYGRKEEFDTYLKMHEIAGHDLEDIENTYKERYMPAPNDMRNRFAKMHKDDFENVKALAMQMYRNLDEIENKCEADYLDKLELKLPTIHSKSGKESFEVLKTMVYDGLKERGSYTKEYVDRVDAELEVIEFHGFSDYFMIVADYVTWSKNRGIVVGPGRGSVCNSLVAYALKITEVDSLFFDLDFRRFLRKDKKKVPDIDLDFETSRRAEVIEYLCDKYKGHAARICSYGLYRVDNLTNDLAKVSGLDFDKDTDAGETKFKKSEIIRIKSAIKKYVDEGGTLDQEGLLADGDVQSINRQYDNILIHFSRLYKKVRYIGTHASGVAITDGDLLDYVSLRFDKEGNAFTTYDLSDLEDINVIKFDILGLKTMESINDLRKATGKIVKYNEVVNDPKVIEGFASGNCDGIFQFERDAARNILREIKTDCFNDVVATSAMNRPGPLSMGMPKTYAEGKDNVETASKSKYWEYTKESYGSIVYQEQIQQICINIGMMSWEDTDRVMKMLKGTSMREEVVRRWLEDKETLMNAFAAGAMKNGFTKEEANEVFNKMLVYSFNKGHSVGYTLISVEEMYYKIYYPNEYWFAKLKYAKDESEYNRFCSKAVADGSFIFLPHVNYSVAKTRLRKMEGEHVIQQGLAELKNVGDKAAEYILNERLTNGVFKSYDDFYDRCKSRTVTTRVISTLLEYGALTFDKKVYIGRVKKYNSALYSRIKS